METTELGQNLMEAFELVPDPRSDHGIRHPLSASIAHAVESGPTSPRSIRAKYGPNFAKLFACIANEMISRLEEKGYRTQVDSQELVTV